MKIIGISAYYHDSAACLLEDGKIIAAAQEERFTRKKHDHNFPSKAIQYCLKEANCTIDEIDHIAFYDKPIVKFNRILETYLSYPGRGLKSFIMAMPLWLKQKLWIPDLIQKELGYEGKVLFPEHHESHAASAFFPSPFERAAFLTIDGVGEWATSSFGVGVGNKIKIHSELHFPHSIGLLYSAFTYFTGFKVNSGEYKIMGLAPYGEPKYVKQIYENIIDLKDDGSFKMNMDFFDYATGLKMTNNKFTKIFDGSPRKSESELTQREMDLARSVQEVTEEIMIRMARHVKKVTGEKNLCLAGGVALNCVGNGRLLRENIFDDIWIQPAAGDAGGALGAAYIAYHHFCKKPVLEKTEGSPQGGSYLGSSYSENRIETFLEKHKLPYHKKLESDTVDEVSTYLKDQKIVGWFQGRMEFGPRALGNRSIIGDARSSEMQKKMNLKIKYRESFRPFAPSILEEEISNWFEIDRASPYMLLVADVKKEKQKQMSEQENKLFGIDKLNIVRSEIPAVTHVDYSARIQSVNKKHNPKYHALISKFFEKTECPVIVNTSFNVRGEPIVESPLDAYKCFMRTEMDILVLENFILIKDEQPEFHENIDWRQTYELD
ncbi:MAG: carbamoyltransferase [Ignavibacteriae bacterium]|nr:carbamoyltransferase [Ignavibacteriota bacterium]